MCGEVSIDVMHAVMRARIGSDGWSVVAVVSCRISAYIVEYAMERRGVWRKIRVCIWW